MRTKFIVFCMTFSFCCTCANAQNGTNNEIVSFLSEFYSEYSNVRHRVENIPTLDSLQEKYCSKKFNLRLKKNFENSGLDHDLLTADWGIRQEYLSTLKITQAPTSIDSYLVSYIIEDFPVSFTETAPYLIELKVTVVKEDEGYKIDGVEGDGKPL